MNFKERLKAFENLSCDAERPSQSTRVELCHPAIVRLERNVVGLVNSDAAALMVAGIGSHRLLCAVLDVLDELARAPAGSSDAERAQRAAVAIFELMEARQVIDEHTTSVTAAIAAAQNEHQALHAREATARGNIH